MPSGADGGRLLRVLHIEDNAGDVRLIAEALQESGLDLEVYVVSDGTQAMEFLRHEGQFAGAPRPTLILLDLDLPRKGGREVLFELKSDPALKSIPVVVLTTSTAPLDIADAYALHANCYVTKPVDLQELFEPSAPLGGFGCNWRSFPRADEPGGARRESSYANGRHEATGIASRHGIL